MDAQSNSSVTYSESSKTKSSKLNSTGSLKSNFFGIFPDILGRVLSTEYLKSQNSPLYALFHILEYKQSRNLSHSKTDTINL